MNFEIVLATNNKHKLQEVREILSPHKIIVYGLSDLNVKIKDVEENNSTYVENALAKAKAIQKITNMPIIADDSGLEISSLNHEPGVYSARYASSLGGHDQAIKEILKRLENTKNRSARFVCQIVLLNTEDKPLIFEGIAKGYIAEKIMGENGFGYDPIFIEEETNQCFGLMDKKEKNAVSHRARALKKLITYLRINGFIPL
ncbi:MAG TPA: RdgB/HAM1 family non-canonical purine NTP pyrophosphatase [Erysipelotrichaceae bacterium]|nr:RdgB/HAM1 family non-canonical purine NTP pyrophosphatase [Erysipelotrichaceae bacterium]